MEIILELTIIIPAYNEEENLKIVLPDLLDFGNQHNWKIIITNDGSKDHLKAYLDIFYNSDRIKVVHHKLNMGSDESNVVRFSTSRRDIKREES